MLTKNIFWQIITQIIGIVSGFATSIITARILGPEGRGEFSLILNTSGFLAVLFGFSINMSIIHVISTNKMKLEKTINSFSLLVLILCLFTAILIFVFPFEKYSFLLPNDLGVNKHFYLLTLVGLFILSMFGSLYTSILSGGKYFWETQRVTIFFYFFSIAVYVLLYIFKSNLHLSLKFFIWCYLVIMSVPALGAYIMYKKTYRPKMEFDFLSFFEIKYVLGYSMLGYIGNIFQFLSYRMDFWFVEYFSGSKQLGLYSLAVNLAQMLWLLPQAIGMVLVSYSGSESGQKGVENTSRLSRIALFLVLNVSLFLFFTIDFFMPLFYGSDFKEASVVFKVLLIGIAPFSITTIIASYFIGIGLMKFNVYCSIIGFLVGLVFDWVLIPKLGIMGAAIATIVAYFCSTMFTVFIYCSKTGSSLNNLLIIKKEDFSIIKEKFSKSLASN
jgi:O-antigen/teichoic acid export membrane protein